MTGIRVNGTTREVTLEPDREVAPHQHTLAELERFRAAAFREEADPLFFKWQAGEATQAEWEQKRAEIRDRFPYP